MLGVAPCTATRKPRAFSKYALKGDALPCLSLQQHFHSSPESSHPGLLRDTKLITLVYTSKMYPQNGFTSVISTRHDGLVFSTRRTGFLDMTAAQRSGNPPKSNPEMFLQLSHTWASWISPLEGSIPVTGRCMVLSAAQVPW